MTNSTKQELSKLDTLEEGYKPPTTPSFFRRIRLEYHEYLGELACTMFQMCLGLGICAQISLAHTADLYLAAWLVWGFAVMCGIYIGGGLSGAHMNAAVTIANAVHGRFPWRKVPGYILSQVTGAFIGASLVYLHYHTEINHKDPLRSVVGKNATSGIFYVSPVYPNRTNWVEFGSEAFASGLLLFVLFAIGAPKSTFQAPATMAPLAVGFAVSGIGLSVGGYALNSSRDLGPRLFTSLIYGSEVFTSYNYYFVVPLIAPIVGGIIGSSLHELLCVYE